MQKLCYLVICLESGVVDAVYLNKTEAEAAIRAAGGGYYIQSKPLYK